MAGDVDEEFNAWIKQHQPMQKILMHWTLPVPVVKTIQNELKQAFVQGYARGVASEVARFPADHPELGPVR